MTYNIDSIGMKRSNTEAGAASEMIKKSGRGGAGRKAQRPSGATNTYSTSEALMMRLKALMS